MRVWRDIIADRVSGGLLGVLLALSFAVQTLVAGFATAAMAAPDPLSVICSSKDEQHRPADGRRQHECPCRLLCSAGVQAQTALAPSDAPALPIRFSVRVDCRSDAGKPLSGGPVVSQYDARGPPIRAVE